MNGSGRVSHSHRSYQTGGTGKGSFEPVPYDEDEGSSGSEESGSQSVYSEDDDSSYESDQMSSKESTHQTFNIAKKESNRVRVWRTVLSLMLVVTAVIVIVTTYLFLTDNEENEFNSTVSEEKEFSAMSQNDFSNIFSAKKKHLVFYLCYFVKWPLSN